MPSQKKESTIFRQWAMLHCLSASKQQTQDIHQRLASEHHIFVSENTVLRDLKSLESAGLPIERTDGKPINWYIKKEWKDKLGGMTDAEALMIFLAAQHLQHALPCTLLQPLQDLQSLAQKNLNAKQQQTTPNNHAQWLSKIRIIPAQQPQLIPTINLDVQRLLTQALLDNQPITARYKGYELTKLSPLALVVRGNVLYLAATCNEESEVKHFALHRFDSVELLYGETLNQPADFDIDRLLASGWGHFIDSERQQEIRLVCWCDTALKNHLVEMPLAKGQWFDFKNPVNGRYQLTVTLPYTWQLRMWLLSQGSRVQVQQPEWLRKEMREELERTLAAYQDPV